MANTRIRMTVAGHIYFQIPKTDAVHIPLAFDRGVLEPEQPYSRSPRTGIGPEWTQLDLGWLSDCVGMVIIQNLEKPNQSGYPQEDDKVLELGYWWYRDVDEDKPHFKIHPGESQPITPSHPAYLYLRCKNGPALYSITVLPK